MRLGDLPRGTQLHGDLDGPESNHCFPSQSVPGPFSLRCSRPGAPIHPVGSSALAGSHEYPNQIVAASRAGAVRDMFSVHRQCQA